MGTRRSVGIWLVLFAAILAAIVLVKQLAEQPTKAPSRANNRADSAAGKRTHAIRAGAPGAPKVHEARHNSSATGQKITPPQRQRRAQIRAQVIAAAQAREAANPLPDVKPDPEIEPEPGQLTKRVEGHEALHAELNRDAMPLVHECIEAAQKRQPNLAGMLAVGFEIVADEELGAIIEDVTFPDQNEVDESELHECIDASLMSMLLAPGSENGRSKLMLTIPIEIETGPASPEPVQ